MYTTNNTTITSLEISLVDLNGYYQQHMNLSISQISLPSTRIYRSINIHNVHLYFNVDIKDTLINTCTCASTVK